jgi:DNA-binding transcriptional MerR regulator
MDTIQDKLTIQEVVEATGLSAYTLRYYERIGLIHSVDRQDNSHRRYSQDDVGWINFLTKLRATGMSIQEMQAYAELQREGDATLPERLDMLKALRERVIANIAALQENLGVVDYKIELYSEIVAEQLREATSV